MHGTDRAAGVPLVDDRRNIPLGGTLGDGPHVDAGLAQGAEHLGGNSGTPAHAVTDDRENAAVPRDADILDGALIELASKRPLEHGPGSVHVLLGQREADGMLGTRLGNQHHGNIRVPKRGKDPHGGAGHADHPGALEIDEGDAMNARDPLDVLAVGGRRDAGAGLVRREGIADHERNAVLDGRRHGAGMDHFCAEIRQFHRLAVGQAVHDGDFRHQPRVAAQDAVHVGPDMDLRGIQEGAEN